MTGMIKKALPDFSLRALSDEEAIRMANLPKTFMERYNRQIMMPEIGKRGQEKLKEARIFLAGLGGLGSVSAFYLVAAGVGALRIADGDRVEISNLNRQIIHWTDDIGKLKTDSAMEKLRRLNPDCEIECVPRIAQEDNIHELIEGCTLIMDGTDNLDSRYALNRGALEKKIPFIFGGVDGFNGMVTTFVPGETPCLECLFPKKTFKKKMPGVLGPVPGIVACIQVIEAIKLVLGLGGDLKGRLLYLRTSDMRFRQIDVDRNPGCQVCS